jgi:hypothetical protein
VRFTEEVEERTELFANDDVDSGTRSLCTVGGSADVCTLTDSRTGRFSTAAPKTTLVNCCTVHPGLRLTVRALTLASDSDMLLLARRRDELELALDECFASVRPRVSDSASELLAIRGLSAGLFERLAARLR